VSIEPKIKYEGFGGGPLVGGGPGARDPAPLKSGPEGAFVRGAYVRGQVSGGHLSGYLNSTPTIQ